MWIFALAIFFGCKWITLLDAIEGNRVPSLARALGYLFAWPGMDARAFLSVATAPNTSANPLWPVLKILAGLIFVLITA